MNKTTQPRCRTPIALIIVFLLIGGMVNLSWALETRPIDGTGNNLQHPEWGSTHVQLLRHMDPDYENGSWTPSGYDRPNVREISNTVADQDTLIYNRRYATDMLWQWGQFLDHDIDLTESAEPAEPFNIHIPQGDPHFDPEGTGTHMMPLNRSAYDHSTGQTPDNPRQQINQITAFIDGSMVYGSDSIRAKALRTLDGTGRLKTSAGNLLPFNTEGLPNAGGPSSELFVAGDVRANEQVGLTALHTLFVREHNRLARNLYRRHPEWTGDQIYERARAKVGTLIQVITYKEFLPILLGPKALKPYSGYDPEINPGISNVFSTAAYRLGHSMLSPQLLRLKRNGHPIKEGSLALRDAFFAPWRLTQEGGIDPLLHGLVKQRAQAIDPFIIDDVRNFLFGPPGAGGFDLASLNLQRGRDHGLPTYNEARLAYGLPPAVNFADISSNSVIQERLQAIYGTVEFVDIWIGGLAEDHRRGAMVGKLFFRILVDQFERLRDGDRHFYLNQYGPYRIKRLERTRLADIVRRNTSIGNEIQDQVFLLHKDHHTMNP